MDPGPFLRLPQEGGEMHEEIKALLKMIECNFGNERSFTADQMLKKEFGIEWTNVPKNQLDLAMKEFS